MYLQVKVIPRSQKTEFVEKMEDGTLKFRLKAPPEGGKANAELTKFLASRCTINPDEIKIISGFASTRKLLKIPDNAILPW
ncbi:DUF167 domain-containing protein [Patescibacteria group bacterium]|nr:DUF167 domain-containing protein [Patescibacteria group bacterium]